MYNSHKIFFYKKLILDTLGSFLKPKLMALPFANRNLPLNIQYLTVNFYVYKR